ncbi:hypothetical protein [Nonlabens antarcticus]|uniref:hypothetical protein n=1 Tax=Nonlabens antarcticus TaxID=392714 RepID=UPI001891B74C|nr:hypothetical protein [Nonlabens antarcticus]
MKYTLCLLAVLFLVSSCKNEESNQIDNLSADFDQLTEQTIEVHDEVMPKMGDLMELSTQIDERSKVEDISDEKRQELLFIKSDLDAAHTAMMDWMKDYSTAFPYEAEEPSTKDELDKKMPVLQEYYNEMEAVKEQINDAIAIAELALSGS